MATTIHQQHPPPPQHVSHLPPVQATSRMSPHLPLQVPQPRPPPSIPALAPLAHDLSPAGQPSSPPGQPHSLMSGVLPPQNGPIPLSAYPQASSSKSTPDAHSRDRDPDFNQGAGASGSSDRKRPRVLMEDASIVASEDRAEWYYPAATRPAAASGTDEFDLDAASSTGNWGNKLIKGARWVRNGQMTSWAPGRAEWEMEERARKRVKTLLLKQTPRSSPPSPTLPHLRAPTPPLTAPYAVPPKEYSSYTSFLVDPSVQHTYTNTVVASLERTGTEFIEGEGALRTALGALWQAMSKEYPKTAGVKDDSAVPSPAGAGAVNGKSLPAIDGDAADVRMSSPGSSTVTAAEPISLPPLQALQQLFISTGDVTIVPDNGPPTTLPPFNQVQSYEWAIEILRELFDDTREYMDRLDELRELSGVAEAAKKQVWKLIKERALEEMEGPDSQADDDEGEDGSDY